MMQLISFEEKNINTLISWIPDEKFNMFWCGNTFLFPLNFEQIKNHICQPNVYPFLVTINEQAAGYIDLVKTDDNVYKICRVLIADKSMRGKGLGEMLMQKIINFAAENFKVSKLVLNVMENNIAAIKLYKKLGFTIVRREERLKDEEGNLQTSFLMKKTF